MAAVHGQVASKLVRAGKALGAVWPGAGVWLFTCVSAHVGLEVVRAGELPLADLTLKRADSSVLAAMATELVRSRKPFAAVVHFAGVRLLPSVLTDVHLEMGELHVAFGAPWVQADEGLAALIISLSDLLNGHGDHLRNVLLGGKSHGQLVWIVHGRQAGHHPLLLLRLVGGGE